MRIFFILLILISKSSLAKFDMNERMIQSYQYILNLEFESANNLLNAEMFQNKQNRMISLQRNYIDFLTILIGEDQNYYEISKNKKKQRINFLKKGDQESPYYLYTQAEIYLQWSFIYLKNQDYTSFIYDFIKSYRLFEKNSKKFPEFSLNEKGLSLINTVLGAVPNQFQWMLDLIGLSGDVKNGISQMQDILNNKELQLYQTEVIFILTFLQLNLSNDVQEYENYLNKIGDRYKINILLNFASARLSNSLGMNDYCINVLENRPTSKSSYPFYYLDYLHGMSYLYKLELDKSKKHFLFFLSNFKGENYIKSAYQKITWISFLAGNKDYKSYYNHIINNGDDYIDEDKVSQRQAETKKTLSLELLKARLLYDGGYYEKADKIISQFSINKNQKNEWMSEYYYRLARIKSKLDYSDNTLIDYYEKSINSVYQSNDYYGPMSALQIAYIYENNLDINKANIYFKKCLSFTNFDFERGIHQKAKIGLSRIN